MLHDPPPATAAITWKRPPDVHVGTQRGRRVAQVAAHGRLRSAIGYLPPAEHESMFYARRQPDQPELVTL